VLSPDHRMALRWPTMTWNWQGTSQKAWTEGYALLRRNHDTKPQSRSVKFQFDELVSCGRANPDIDLQIH
jgi:hypothetical protein